MSLLSFERGGTTITLPRLIQNIETMSEGANAAWEQEHNADGTHKHLDADALTVSPFELRTIVLPTMADGAFQPLHFLDAAGARILDPFGWLFLVTSGRQYAIYSLRGSDHATAEISDPGAVFTASSGSASSLNVYWSSTRERYEVENLSGANRSVSALLLRMAF